MGWFSGTPKWYDDVIKSFGATQESGSRSEAVYLNAISISKLEQLRKQLGLDHEKFAFSYGGCKTVTTKLQGIIYRRLKNTAPPGTPEDEILSQLLVSRLRGFEPHLDRIAYLDLASEISKAAAGIHTLDDAVKFILSLSDRFDNVYVREVRKEIDLLLASSSSSQ